MNKIFINLGCYKFKKIIKKIKIKINIMNRLGCYILQKMKDRIEIIKINQRKYKYQDVIYNNILCGKLNCYKEYVNIKFQ